MAIKIKRSIVIGIIILSLVLVTVFYRPLIAAFKEYGILKPDLSGNYLKVLDVGEADAILVVSEGKTALIDTGDINDSGAALAVKLKKIGVEKIDVLVLTHSHTDHAGGLYAILSQFEVGYFYYTSLFGEEDNAEFYFSSVRKLVREKEVTTDIIEQGMAFRAGNFKFKVLSCGIDSGDNNSVNNASAVIMAQSFGVKFLLMADAGEYTERYLVNNFKAELDCDVLKVGHHGSASSTNYPLLQAATPRYAAVSCGDQNIYGHPAKEVIDRLNDCGAKILRTDINSDICFNVDEHANLVVETLQ